MSATPTETPTSREWSHVDAMLIQSLQLIDGIVANGHPDAHQGCMRQELCLNDVRENPDTFNCLRYPMKYDPKTAATKNELTNAEARMALWVVDWIRQLSELDEKLDDQNFIMRSTLAPLTAFELAWRTANLRRSTMDDAQFNTVHLPCEAYTTLDSDFTGMLLLKQPFVSLVLRQTWGILDLAIDEKESLLIKALLIVEVVKTCELYQRTTTVLRRYCAQCSGSAIVAINRNEKLLNFISDLKAAAMQIQIHERDGKGSSTL